MTTSAQVGAAYATPTRGVVTAWPSFPEGDDAVARWARLAPQRAAVIDGVTGRRTTYAALDAMAMRWAARLARHGVRRGDRVALLAGTRVECVALFHACLRLGAALVPLNWRLSVPELARVLTDAEPAVLVIDERHATVAARAEAERGAATPALALDAADDEDSTRVPNVVAGAADDATMILYTSGSTGRPKGVVLPRRQLLFNAIATTVGWRLGPDDVAPVATPMFHTGGWHVFTTPLLHVGATVVLCDGFDADRFLAALDEQACTVAFAVPTQLTMLLASPRWGTPLPRLRYFISGGAPCPPSVRAAVRAAGYGMRQGYGLTECGPNCFATNDETADAHPHTVGWPNVGLEMRLVRDDGTTADVDEPGELWLRGPQMFAGYFRAPDRTAEAVTSDGWLRTGDLACRDAAGRYTICGRKKEMYISGGENVFPGEVEAVLCDAPDVAEAAVVGVPDAKWGEVGHAFLVAARGASIDPAAVLAHARGALAGYKLPKRLTVLAELPRLGSGKVDRAALAARAGAES
ncbi:AMP-dependent synthetase and ligase [Gemmatirosa kalamazoonensis]|uniref:AMP-dependent synthetase and ligase n=1 Tax=Gemmatirosa kalamazoonensis TaxID=861299 RepID=W0RP78_9BACT|nr:AMP-binding protein [Gemmatirosa kalamazoonensis]AHG91263.1 AMP-dependent synthetase and ligase [Gemmatirosa kalamazoonensis]